VHNITVYAISRRAKFYCFFLLPKLPNIINICTSATRYTYNCFDQFGIFDEVERDLPLDHHHHQHRLDQLQPKGETSKPTSLFSVDEADIWHRQWPDFFDPPSASQPDWPGAGGRGGGRRGGRRRHSAQILRRQRDLELSDEYYDDSHFIGWPQVTNKPFTTATEHAPLQNNGTTPDANSTTPSPTPTTSVPTRTTKRYWWVRPNEWGKKFISTSSTTTTKPTPTMTTTTTTRSMPMSTTSKPTNATTAETTTSAPATNTTGNQPKPKFNSVIQVRDRTEVQLRLRLRPNIRPHKKVPNTEGLIFLNLI